MEKPMPMVANNQMLFSPKGGNVFFASGVDQSRKTHVRNMRQMIILIMPYAINLAPNSQYFMSRVMVSRSRALRMGLRWLKQCGGVRPIHCRTMSSKQSISMRKRLTKMQISQRCLALQLRLKCLKMAESKSGQLPTCRTQRQHEQQLKNPEPIITRMLSAYPVYSARTGSRRLMPPIIPLIIESTTMVVEREDQILAALIQPYL